MLIPFGWLASSGGGAAGSYELISTTVLSATTSTITFSSIPSTYKHLQLRMVSRSSQNGAVDRTSINTRFNGSSSGYAMHWLYGNGSSVESYSQISTTEFNVQTSGTAESGVFSPCIIDILDYASTVKNKTTRAFWGINGESLPDRQINLASNLWANTAAITSIVLSSGVFQINSRFSLYGIKG